jgi:hypothetical protein
MEKDILIQSAASVGNNRLVVWGATQGSVEDARPVLMMSILEGVRATGDPVRLTSLDARPTGYVQVVTITNRFLVLWNDRRNGRLSAYMRLLTRDGVPIAGEVRLDDRGIAPAGVLATVEGTGYRLLWSPVGADSILACSLDATGAIAAPARLHALGHVVQFSRPTWTPGYTVVDRGDSIPLLITNNGTERSLKAAAGKFRVPYFLGDDGGVASLSGDTVRVYKSVYDSIPSRTTMIPRLAGAIAGTGLITERYGGIVVFRAIADSVATGPSEQLVVSLIRSEETSPGIWGPSSIADSMVLAAPGRECEHASARPVGVRHQRGWYNRLSLVIRFEGLDSSGCPGDSGTRPIAEEYDRSIDELMQVTSGPLDMSRTISVIPIGRIASDTASEVALAISGNQVHLAAPVPTREITFGWGRPGISDYYGHLMVGWLVAGEVTGEDTAASEGEWVLDAVTPIGNVFTLASSEPDPLYRLSVRPSRTIELLRTDGMTALSIVSRWQQRNGNGVLVDNQRFTLSLPTTEGWLQAVGLDDANGLLALRRLAYAFDPVRGEIICAWGFCNSLGVSILTHVVAVVSDGSRAWWSDRLDVPSTKGFWAIPIDEDDFDYVDHDLLYRIRNGKRVLATPMPAGLDGEFFRLPGPLILHAHVEGDTLVASLFDLDGVPVGSASVWAPWGFSSDMFLAANPSDSTLAFFSGSSKGVVMVRLNQKLEVLQPPTIISDSGMAASRPAGLYRNDSLFIVWEALRGGTHAIYGRIVPPSRLSEVWPDDRTSAPAREPMRLSITPNPSRDLATVTISPTPPAGSVVTCTVLDILGREVLSIDSDDPSLPMTIPTSEIPGGVYLLRLTACGTTCVSRFVVLR